MPRARKPSSRGTRTNQLVSGTTFVTNPSGVTIEPQNGITRNIGGTAYYPPMFTTNNVFFEYGLMDSLNNATVAIGGVTYTVLVKTLSTITSALAVIPSIYRNSSGVSTDGPGVSIVSVMFSGSGVTMFIAGANGVTTGTKANSGTSIQYFAFGT